MKKYSLLAFFAVSLFFVGCTIEKRHYNSGYHIEWLSQKGKVKKAEPVAQPEKEMDQQLAQQTEVMMQNEEIAMVAVEAVEVAEVVAPVTSTEQSAASVKKESPSKATVKKEVRQELKAARKEMKAAQQEMKSIEKGYTADASIATLESASSSPLSDVPVIVLVILAIILPPLAVFLHSGIGTEFWISLILTILFWIPGVIYSLLVVLDVI
ncbi:MAG TPA: YqaE/Pmp3 family membrane protein [Flavobacteriales bacterium]